ncbi:hypothetical protein [Burkholderia anthina]|uniref:hypothetical protein n=1 Tax=Burkholderia anthina TaxID=179879 RepID=UPI00158F13A2|nr:hypothetical protein [Burkholderia anthina]
MNGFVIRCVFVFASLSASIGIAHGAALPRVDGVRLHDGMNRTDNSPYADAEHMANPGRFVPVHILHLALKYGRRMPDPQSVAGVFRYEIQMSRFVKRGATFIRERKTLEIVVRESDWTILHFMYY